ncbi:kinase [Verrucomicrobiaceae bacterium SCGC AG-212-N21]|nr:kinase [Verrucomicrobiaceae bacterium SCGC AG-212-N21]
MIIARTPFRISFLGGGTDYPAWYRQHGGAVLGTTIDKYCYITCRYLPPFHEHRYSIVYSQMERCDEIDQIQHPAVREVLRYFDVQRGLEIHTDADLPGRSGMGSSSAFTVGLIHAIHALQGRVCGKQQLAREGIHLEQEVLKEAVGSQDQVHAAYGGFNHVIFHTGGEISVRPVTISPQRFTEFGSHLMLFYTGIRRTAASVAQTFVTALDDRKRQLRIMNDLVNEGIAILSGTGPVADFGELLHEAWQAKRSLSQSVSNPEVDSMYERARSAGATGGKLTGAGGGGFLLLFADPCRHESIRSALSELVYVPIKLDFSGSQIVYYQPEQDYGVDELARAQQIIKPFRELEQPRALSRG